MTRFRFTKRKIIIIIIVILFAGLIFFMDYMESVNNYQAKVDSISYSKIDMSSVPDGVYTGECDVDFIYAKVKVTIKEGKMTDINLLEHNNDKGKSAEKIVDNILKEQSIEVDTITSATNSSKVIKKAVDNALSSAI